MTYDEAIIHSLTVKWKIEECTQGSNCWCRTIVPEEPIIFTYIAGGIEQEDTLDYIIPSGSIYKEHAEHIVKLHNENL